MDIMRPSIMNLTAACLESQAVTALVHPIRLVN